MHQRKFDEAQKNDQTRAGHAMTLIQKLYDTERKAQGNNSLVLANANHYEWLSLTP